MPATKNINAEKIQGNLDVNSITATTISASTYQNLPIDPDTYITGFTYSSNTFTISDNSGNTLNATFNDVTGLTVNGTLSATTISGGTFYGDGSNLIGVSGGFTGGTVSGNTIFTSGVTINTISGGTFYGDGSGLTNLSVNTSSSKLFNYYNFI